MRSVDTPNRSLDGLPEMLTVPEAARVLRIGRTLAYQLASRYLAGEPDGLPAIRLGGCLRVPRWALEDLTHDRHVVADGELQAAVAAAVGPTAHGRRQPADDPALGLQSPSNPHAGAPQLSLLDGS